MNNKFDRRWLGKKSDDLFASLSMFNEATVTITLWEFVIVSLSSTIHHVLSIIMSYLSSSYIIILYHHPIIIIIIISSSSYHHHIIVIIIIISSYHHHHHIIILRMQKSRVISGYCGRRLWLGKQVRFALTGASHPFKTLKRRHIFLRILHIHPSLLPYVNNDTYPCSFSMLFCVMFIVVPPTHI